MAEVFILFREAGPFAAFTTKQAAEDAARLFPRAEFYEIPLDPPYRAVTQWKSVIRDGKPPVTTETTAVSKDTATERTTIDARGDYTEVTAYSTVSQAKAEEAATKTYAAAIKLLTKPLDTK